MFKIMYFFLPSFQVLGSNESLVRKSEVKPIDSIKIWSELSRVWFEYSLKSAETLGPLR